MLAPFVTGSVARVHCAVTGCMGPRPACVGGRFRRVPNAVQHGGRPIGAAGEE